MTPVCSQCCLQSRHRKGCLLALILTREFNFLLCISCHFLMSCCGYCRYRPQQDSVSQPFVFSWGRETTHSCMPSVWGLPGIWLWGKSGWSQLCGVTSFLVLNEGWALKLMELTSILFLLERISRQGCLCAAPGCWVSEHLQWSLW